MQKCRLFLLAVAFSLLSIAANAQGCSICTKTAAQLGEKPAKALNTGIVYLAFTPIVILGAISYYWYRNNYKNSEA
ncbi:MAG: hypothetical protein P0Y53_04360 [Candidatus Pseudobacter hemicellulosilyticus]|uniref:Uncharacterized protein n=1 Tax=Candidatus Pseudobacter hemicellulosilyticus TaxID=3121375 RepID=A0AAJ6BHZ7_9BACT|nr:MAG: hypothetical protein P0Y53_04360 [Pseudobacter sp.]